MSFLWLFLLLPAAYLLSSVNLALLLARWIKGVDLRTTGTGVAGTANTARTLGRGWASLVFLFDLSKSLLPMLLARRLLPLGSVEAVTAALGAVAAAAILGHCRPLFHGFRGGGGVATGIGALLFFVPLEFLVSAAAAFLTAMLLLRRAEHPVGQWTPVLFLALTPLVSFIAGAFLDVPVAAGLRFGGKPWPVGAAALAISLLILLLNPRIAGRLARESRHPRP